MFIFQRKQHNWWWARWRTVSEEANGRLAPASWQSFADECNSGISSSKFLLMVLTCMFKKLKSGILGSLTLNFGVSDLLISKLNMQAQLCTIAGFLGSSMLTLEFRSAYL
ncbi:hypothetical protein HAX54_009763 [Datura stramonium]|uniref:Uncharacterized protein n=1 Tax=Datura stramonium TaxID=4076 RepID=A0ABS8RX40_DATST|nr:hypothetical protein [Datura stramonium]